MFKKLSVILALLLCISAHMSCGGTPTTDALPAESNYAANSSPVADATGTSWPAVLPVDVVQPWEELSSDGYVLPDNGTRSVSSINADSEFTPGVQRDDEGGAVADLGEASRLTSGAASSGELSWAQYRIPLVGVQPGVIIADVNLRPKSDGSTSEYWLGLSDYGSGGWDWRGPFSESHIRVQPGPGDFISTLGNTFVVVVAYDGADFDVVGVGLNPVDPTDSTPPDAPVLSSVTPVSGGLLITWLHAGAADLAGFQVYHSQNFFADGDSPGVTPVAHLEGGHRFLLADIDSIRYIRVSAVDVNGNEGTVSDIDSETPLAGTPLMVQLETDLISGLIGTSMNLTATGADTYDWDLDGDGAFEITADATGTQSVTPDSSGIIRPAVRGSASGGDAVAFGSVSLLLSSNSRPIAQGFATPTTGHTPLPVTFTSLSSDFDGNIVRWGWDFDGDKTYDYTTMDPLLINPPPHVYDQPGVYNAKFRAWDDEGAWDVDTVAIHVTEFVGFDWVYADDYYGTGSESSLAIVAGYPALSYSNATNSQLEYVRALNAKGTLWGEPQIVDATVGSGRDTSLEIVDGHPAISYVETTPDSVFFIRADDPLGESWTTPRVALDPVDTEGTALRVIDGNPAVAYVDSLTANLKYIRADSIDGSTWGNPAIVIDSTGNNAGYPDLEEIDGRPAVAYWDSSGNLAMYIRALNATGNTALDWPVAGILPAGTFYCDDYVRLAEVNGRPAVTFSGTMGDFHMIYFRALDSTGQTAGDWQATGVGIAEGGTENDLAVIDGYPAVCYEDGSKFWYMRANDINGDTWGNRMIVYDVPTYPVGNETRMLELNRAPIISTYHSQNKLPIFFRPIFE